METDADAAVKAIDQLFADYGGVWPPRGDFSEWPPSWTIYMETCDEMPRRMYQNDGPERFREWMKQMFKKVDIDDVMENVNQRLTKDNQKLIGFLACLSHLKSTYRWGSLPVMDTERQRTSMSFPKELSAPFDEIVELHGISSHANFFTLFYANLVYGEDGDPVNVRFPFNSDLEVFEMEKEFFVSTTKMEVRFLPAVKAASEFIQLTAVARTSLSAAVDAIDRRAELLDIIKDSVTKSLKEFAVFTTWNADKRKFWTKYIESLMAWNLDGENGTSGAETFIATFLDEFFHVPGTSFVYRDKPENYHRMAGSIRNVLYAVRTTEPEDRFNWFLGGPKEEDILWMKRCDILRVLHMWRLSHARVAERVIMSSEGLASGLDFTEDLSLSENIRKALDERAYETKVSYQGKKSPIYGIKYFLNIIIRSITNLATFMTSYPTDFDRFY